MLHLAPSLPCTRYLLLPKHKSQFSGEGISLSIRPAINSCISIAYPKPPWPLHSSSYTNSAPSSFIRVQDPVPSPYSLNPFYCLHYHITFRSHLSHFHLQSLQRPRPTQWPPIQRRSSHRSQRFLSLKNKKGYFCYTGKNHIFIYHFQYIFLFKIIANTYQRIQSTFCLI
jgi:hypothetical protein